MKNIKLIIVLLVGVPFFISCDSRTTQDLEGIVTNPTYTKDVKKIMDANCISCHSPNATEPAFPNLDTYQNIADYQDPISLGYPSKLLCSIEANTCTNERMPKSAAPLTNPTITTIKNWINSGFPE